MTARVYCSSPNTNNSFLERLTANNSAVSTSEQDLQRLRAPVPAAVVATATVPAQDMSFYGSGFEDSDNSEAILARRRNVSRNLFGVPSAATAEYARNKLKEMLQKESARWNFDFEAEKPLPGRFQWQPVEGARNPLPVAASAAPKPPQTVVVHAQPQEPPSKSGPTQPKQRRVESKESRPSSIRDPLLVVSSASVETVEISLNADNLRRKYPTTATSTTTTTTTSTSGARTSSTKPLFPPKTGSSSGGESTPPPSPPQLNSMIPATVLVTATAVDPLDDAARKYLSTDSGRRKEKQMKITMYSAVKKRRIGHGTAGAEKKAF